MVYPSAPCAPHRDSSKLRFRSLLISHGAVCSARPILPQSAGYSWPLVHCKRHQWLTSLQCCTFKLEHLRRRNNHSEMQIELGAETTLQRDAQRCRSSIDKFNALGPWYPGHGADRPAGAEGGVGGRVPGLHAADRGGLGCGGARYARPLQNALPCSGTRECEGREVRVNASCASAGAVSVRVHTPFIA